MVENIRLANPNFCIGPQVGTYCTVNNDTAPVNMQIKNSSGTLIRTYTFSPSDVLEPKPYLYDTSNIYTPGLIMPIKSFIIDIANNWRNSAHVSIRSIEFYDADDQLISNTTANFVAYATTMYAVDYKPSQAFDTTLSKINSWQYNSWISYNGVYTNQRLICVFNELTYVKKIVINNNHHNGIYIDYGAKDIAMYYTQTSYTDTTYGKDAASFVKIFDGQLAQHISGNYVDDQIMPLSGDDISFSHSEFYDIVYVGPLNQSSTYNGAVFYTLERVGLGTRNYYTYERNPEPIGDYKQTSGSLVTAKEVSFSGNKIKKWRVNNTNFTLDLVSSTNITNTSSSDWIDATDMVISTYKTTLLSSLPTGTGEIEINTSGAGLSKYDTVLLGPSSDTTNLGAFEELYIHAINNNVVTVKSYTISNPTKYEYVTGDPVTVITGCFLFSNAAPVLDNLNIRTGFLNNTAILYEIDLYNYGSVLRYWENAAFMNVIGSFWNSYYNTISFVKGGNLIHFDTTLGKPSKSQNLNLMKADKTSLLTVYDMDVSGTDIYRLQDERIVRSDSGVTTTEDWSYYNYVVDSMGPYTNSVALFTARTIIGYQGTATIGAIVRDQFGVALNNVTVTFSKQGDSFGSFTPSSGQATTDSNGFCSIQYNASANFSGEVVISGKAAGANTVTGSTYVVGTTTILVHENYQDNCGVFSNAAQVESDNSLFCHPQDHDSESSILCFSRRSFPGGEWKWTGDWIDTDKPTIDIRNVPNSSYNTAIITTVYQPTLHGIPTDNEGNIDYPKNPLAEFPNLNVLQSNSLQDEGAISVRMAKNPEDTRYLSQNYVSRHLSTGHTTTTDLNQFVFIQEAYPVFWSEKNAVDINYWIRLRPFASSLDPETLKIKVYEVSYLGTTTPVDIAPLGGIYVFDAGGGLEGLEFSYTFPESFHHNAVVFVEIEVYDQAINPNLITVGYWFKIIPDYNKPFVTSKSPGVEEINLPIDSDIKFDLRDNGEGVDIDSVSVYVNNQLTDFSYVEYEPGQYHIICSGNTFHYNQEIHVLVVASDRSENSNTVRDGWTFYCLSSPGPWFNSAEAVPVSCSVVDKKSIREIKVQVYGINDTGVALESLHLDVGGKERSAKITPIIYRLR